MAQNIYDEFYEDDEDQLNPQETIPWGTTGTSTATPQAFDPSRAPSNDDVPLEFSEDFIRRNPNDYHRIAEAYKSQRPAGANTGSVTAQWNNTPSSSGDQSWYAPWFEEFRRESENERREGEARGDALYDSLMKRINDGVKVDRNDPVIRAQSDAYRANQDRASSRYLSEVAEEAGPYANLRGEQRLAAERVGMNTSNFEASLLGEQVEREYDMIQQALSGALGYVSAEQARNLQERLAILGQHAQEMGIDLQSRALEQQWQRALMDNDLSLRGLGLQEWDRGMYWDLFQQGAMD